MADKITIPVKDKSGAEVGRYEFDPAELAPGINKQLLHDVVVMYEANQRVGTMQSRSRAMVAGSKKKMYRQKGTGRARMGGKRTPIRRGGGQVRHCGRRSLLPRAGAGRRSGGKHSGNAKDRQFHGGPPLSRVARPVNL